MRCSWEATAEVGGGLLAEGGVEDIVTMGRILFGPESVNWAPRNTWSMSEEAVNRTGHRSTSDWAVGCGTGDAALSWAKAKIVGRLRSRTTRCLESLVERSVRRQGGSGALEDC